MSRVRPYLPAFLLLLFSTWCGTFDGAAHGARAAGGHLALAAVVAIAGGAWRDPLRLPRGGNLLLALLAVALVLSYYQSPVPRAGRVGLVLLGAYLLVPAFVETCWRGAGARRRGLVALSAATGLVAAWSLIGVWGLGTPGASLPLGHHNLLAAWLVTLLPLAALPVRDGGTARVVAAAAALVAIAAIVASRSLSGALALGAVAAVALSRHGPWMAAPLAAVAALPAVRARILAVVSGEDASALARQGYLEAAWRGWWERPWLGWGPGSVSWTLSRFLAPRPGVHPPDQVVTDPHALPLRLAYEVGVAGLVPAVLLAALFLWRRRAEEAADPGLRRAAGLALLGFAVTALAGRTLAAPALPLAAMVAAGAALAAAPPRAREPARRPILVALAMLLLLAPPDAAHLAYDRALRSDDPRAQEELLRRAVRLDPSFPLYRARLALAGGDAGEARRAAEEAYGVAHLWLLAGVLGQERGAPWAAEALVEACELNPLGAMAPFRLATGAAGAAPRSPARAARALLAEPLLVGADELRRRPELVAAAVAELRRAGAADPAWIADLAAAAERLRAASGPARRLVLEMDGEGATALSLHAFRRLPWPAYLDEVTIRVAPEAAIDAAARTRRTDFRVFQGPGCGLSPAPNHDGTRRTASRPPSPP